MPDDEQFYSIWLDQIILEVVEDYFGSTPVLCEAFIRRNYPSEHVVVTMDGIVTKITKRIC